MSTVKPQAAVKNEQGQVVGHSFNAPDEHGNPRWHTLSNHRPDDEVIFRSRTAAIFWLDVVDELTRARQFRGARP